MTVWYVIQSHRSIQLYTHTWLENGRCAVLYPVVSVFFFRRFVLSQSERQDREEQLGVRLWVPLEVKKSTRVSREILIASLGDVDPRYGLLPVSSLPAELIPPL
jgi:hypothetical protein